VLRTTGAENYGHLDEIKLTLAAEN
jgi:hypothetical protein